MNFFGSVAESLGQADNFDVRYITVGAFKKRQSYFLAELFHLFSGRTSNGNLDFFGCQLIIRSSQSYWYIIVFCRCSGLATMFK